MGVKLTQDMIDGAKRAEKQYGVPASITLAQILIESGGSYSGGLSGLAYRFKNLFGIKAGSSWKGKTATMSTKEYRADGSSYTVQAKFRAYDSFQDSIIDHAKLLKNSRYTKHTNSATTLEEYAKGIKAGGYATSPSYANDITKMIKRYNLNQYDGGSVQNIIKGATGGTSDIGDIGSTNSNNVSTSTSKSGLKWWGSAVVVICVIILFLLGTVFFIGSFGGLQSLKPVSTTKNFVNKGA